ncbi:MAG TPA: YeeE/YedE thiosulfate transporter family protein [Ilumatobacteraceae bacterium]|nr:YeeE/YedE thiosulfate transporter family protein [Ilumatobacteraceae bacterium]
MQDYWPWWAGALGLGAATVAFPTFTRGRLGVSGAFERVMHWRSEREAERHDAVLDDAAAFEAALAAETAREFGGEVAATPSTATAEHGAVPAKKPLEVSTQLVLLVSIVIGGALAAITSGRFKWRTDLGPAFSEIVVHGWAMWPVLFAGGILVGIGTRMAGGCSSGHGLSGCSRLEPVSIVATALFFGSAVGMSFLLWKVI